MSGEPPRLRHISGRPLPPEPSTLWVTPRGCFLDTDHGPIVEAHAGVRHHRRPSVAWAAIITRTTVNSWSTVSLRSGRVRIASST